MALREERKEINGKTYYVRQMPPTKALPLKFKLTQIIGSALPKLISSKGKEDAKQAEAFSDALADLFNKINPEDMLSLIKDVVSTATIDGKRIIDGTSSESISFDDAYADNYAEMYQAFFFVLKVNYGNFIKGLGLDMEAIKDKALSKLNQ